MRPNSSLRNFTLLVGLGALFALGGQYACTDDSCNLSRGGSYQTMDDLAQHSVETFDSAVARQGLKLSAAQKLELDRVGHLLGVATLDRPLKHRDGTIEMPNGWLPEIPAGHPWAKPLSTADDAFYSWFEERIVDARLLDLGNPEHQAWANAYLAKVHSASSSFSAWTFASSTECPKK